MSGWLDEQMAGWMGGWTEHGMNKADGPVPLRFALEGPSLFLRGLLSGDLSPPVTDTVLIETTT